MLWLWLWDIYIFVLRIRRPPRSTRIDTLFRDTTVFRYAIALVPGLEQEVADAALHAVETVDLEPGVVLRKALEDLQELVGVGVQVVQVGGQIGRAHV